MGDNAVLHAGQEHHIELQALGRVDGHQIHLALGVVLQLIPGVQGDSVEPAGERGLEIIRVTLPSTEHVDETANILIAPFGYLFVLTELPDQITPVPDLIHQFPQGRGQRPPAPIPAALSIGLPQRSGRLSPAPLTAAAVFFRSIPGAGAAGPPAPGGPRPPR